MRVNDRETARSRSNVLAVEKRKNPRIAPRELAKRCGFCVGQHKTSSAQEIASVGKALVCLQRTSSSHVGSYFQVGVDQARCTAQSDAYLPVFVRLLGYDVI